MSKELVNKVFCPNCNTQILPENAALEVTLTKWVNGYWSNSSYSEYFCQKCAPRVEVIVK